MGTIVTYTYNDSVATIAMDDGKANVLSHTMWEELEAAFDQAEKSGAIVLLKGRDGIFSGGFDLKEMAPVTIELGQMVHLKRDLMKR